MLGLYALQSKISQCNIMPVSCTYALPWTWCDECDECVLWNAEVVEASDGCECWYEFWTLGQWLACDNDECWNSAQWSNVIKEWCLTIKMLQNYLLNLLNQQKINGCPPCKCTGNQQMDKRPQGLQIMHQGKMLCTNGSCMHQYKSSTLVLVLILPITS